MVMKMGANYVLFSAMGVAPKSDFDRAILTEKGFPLASIDALIEQGLTLKEISDLIISPRTLKHRKARKTQLSPAETERVIRIARILTLADKIFGTHEKAMRWLRNPDDRYENTAPIYMLVTETGGRLVEKLLWRIAEGVYA